MNHSSSTYLAEAFQKLGKCRRQVICSWEPVGDGVHSIIMLSVQQSPLLVPLTPDPGTVSTLLRLQRQGPKQAPLVPLHLHSRQVKLVPERTVHSADAKTTWESNLPYKQCCHQRSTALRAYGCAAPSESSLWHSPSLTDMYAKLSGRHHCFTTRNHQQHT